MNELVVKTVEALHFGVHVLLIDLLPPGPHDPRGLHGAVWNEFDEGPYDLPLAEPLTLASYAAGLPVKAYLEHLRVGGSLPDMPLFLIRSGTSLCRSKPRMKRPTGACPRSGGTCSKPAGHQPADGNPAQSRRYMPVSFPISVA